jgi:phosphatidylinositol N-acetylglucosaminyltransferase subunit H
MLTTSPHLHIRRPSPTTVEFTVTTQPPLTLSLRLLLVGLFLCRLVVGTASLLLLWSKWSLSPYSAPLGPYPTAPRFFSDDYIWYAVHYVQTTSVGRLATRLATEIPTFALLPAAVAVFYGVLVRIHVRESLLVLRGLGIQTSSTAGTYLTSAVTRFIPTEKIQDVLVNEAFRGFETRYYLTVVVEGEGDVVVVFPKLLPHKGIVEAVWRGVRGCLYEGLDEDGVVGKFDEKG